MARHPLSLYADFDSSTLWGVSAFEEVRRATDTSGFARLGGQTVVPTTLLADLTRFDPDPASNDVLKVAAACMRRREALLVYMRWSTTA